MSNSFSMLFRCIHPGISQNVFLTPVLCSRKEKAFTLHAIPFMPQVDLGIREHLLPDTHEIVFMGEEGLHNVRVEVRS